MFKKKSSPVACSSQEVPYITPATNPPHNATPAINMTIDAVIDTMFLKISMIVLLLEKVSLGIINIEYIKYDCNN